MVLLHQAVSRLHLELSEVDLSLDAGCGLESDIGDSGQVPLPLLHEPPHDVVPAIEAHGNKAVVNPGGLVARVLLKPGIHDTGKGIDPAGTIHILLLPHACFRVSQVLAHRIPGYPQPPCDLPLRQSLLMQMHNLHDNLHALHAFPQASSSDIIAENPHGSARPGGLPPRPLPLFSNFSLEYTSP